ncbi:MAG TPA: RidA family protein [Hyphomicrobiales bacterium]|nr:RidA family protein [Hyphomicrobiales bacterium]
MPGKIEDRLAALGIVLPTATPPQANYVPTVVSGNQLFVSGQTPMEGGKLKYRGRVGADIALADAQAAARVCAINILAQVNTALGGLDRVQRTVKVLGFVNSAPDFFDQGLVINGASDLFVEVLGDNGRHARSSVGVAALPGGAPVEVEAIFQIA